MVPLRKNRVPSRNPTRSHEGIHETGELSLEATYTNGSREGTLTYFCRMDVPVVLSFTKAATDQPDILTHSPKKRAL